MRNSRGTRVRLQVISIDTLSNLALGVATASGGWPTRSGRALVRVYLLMLKNKERDGYGPL
jgi:hypothetical protein